MFELKLKSLDCRIENSNYLFMYDFLILQLKQKPILERSLRKYLGEETSKELSVLIKKIAS